MLATQERDAACRLALSDSAAALAAARKVSKPWFKCQALACVARFSLDDQVEKIANEAVNTAMSDTDPYRQVAVCAWPLRALAERGEVRAAKVLLTRLIQSSPTILNGVCRMDALHLVFEAAWPFHELHRERLLSSLLSACHSSNSWKGAWLLAIVASVVASEDRVQAQQIIDQLRDGKNRRKAQRNLDCGKINTVRSFF